MNKFRLRKISLTVFIIYMLTLVPLPINLAVSAGNCPEQEYMYLVDDVFATKNVKDNSGKTIISAWDLRDLGGKFEGNFYSSFKITDSHSQLPVEMNRKFDPVKSGELTTLFTFKFLTKMNGVSFSLAQNSREAMRIVAKDGNLVLVQPEGAEYILSQCVLNTDYGVKAVLNINEQTQTIYVNGALAAENVPFTNNVENINNFNINTGNETMGEMFFDTVKIYKGYAVNERYVSTLNNFPSDWANQSSGGSASVVKVESRQIPDIYSLKLDSAGGDAIVSKSVSPQSRHMIYETKMIIPKKVDGAGISVLNGNQKILTFATSGDNFCYQSGNGDLVPFYNYTANVWYHVKLDIDLPASTAKVYLNGKLKAENIPLDTNLKQIDSVTAQLNQGEQAYVYMDDFLLYACQGEPEDYVPAPVKADSPDQLLGMQICSMWREGDHRGCDWINPWEQRRPYLGYYDEGSPEVSDWEIKYMLEHGIDFQMYCWYRNLAFNEAPIKDSALNYALHDGYFNAKYSSQMPFMILWENASYSIDTATDFENNLVPYWMEYYFKDDRYLKINNRPVIGIYYYDRLKTAFGGIDGIKTEIEFLNNKCREAGLGEPILFLSTGTTNAELLQEMKDVGFDAVYNYTWGLGGANIGIQEYNTQKQGDANAIDVIPSMSMGRDDTAWGLMPGGWTTTETYTELLSWAKNNFLVNHPNKNTFGQNMTIFTTWNEYGEGHFISPAGLNGFGYLDAIKNVYSGESEHKDIIPTQAQKDRFSHLYMKDRVVTLSKSMLRSAIPKDVKKGWYFDTEGDSEGWINLNYVTNFTSSGGAISGTVTGNDSSVLSPGDLNIDISDVTYIKLRMKNNGESQGGEMFFVTTDDKTWDEAKKLDFSTSPFDTQYTDYYLALWSRSNWKGTLKQFRIDPSTAATGSFSIDSIELLYNNEPIQGVKLMIDSSVQQCDPEPIMLNNRTMVPVRKVSESLGAKLDWDSWNETVSILKNDTFIQLKLGENTAKKNGETINLDQGAVLENDSTYVPLRFIAESLGVDVDWDDDEQTVYITTPEGAQREASESKSTSVMKRELLYNTEFNKDGDFEGWLSNEFVSGATVEKGAFRGNSLGNDPILISGDTIGVNTKDIKNISIGFKNGTIDDIARMYFVTAEDPTFDENKSILFSMKIKDSGITQYNFDPNNNLYWKGNLSRLRFDFSATAGEWVVDYIRLEGDYREVTDTQVTEVEESSITKNEKRFSWEFDINSALDGWTLNKHMGDVKISNGKLTATYVGPNPFMETLSDLGIETSAIKGISIKYRNLSDSNKAKLYFITDKDSTWTNDKSFEFEPMQNDNVGERYTIDTSDNSLWSGTLKGLRFEPAYGGGGVSIDYIRLELGE